MKGKLKIVLVIVIVILMKILFSYILNEMFISNYNRKIYKTSYVESLLVLNIAEPCIAHYNYGNLLYKQSDFEKAIEEYEKALKLFPNEKQECSIRINLALAMLQQINEEDTSEANITNTLAILAEAKAVLCENGCANANDDNGHSPKAEQLKRDIEEKEEQLKKNSASKDEKDENNEEKTEQQKQNNTKEEKIKQAQEEANQMRDIEMQHIQDLSDYDYYKGKRW